MINLTPGQSSNAETVALSALPPLIVQVLLTAAFNKILSGPLSLDPGTAGQASLALAAVPTSVFTAFLIRRRRSKEIEQSQQAVAPPQAAGETTLTPGVFGTSILPPPGRRRGLIIFLFTLSLLVMDAIASIFGVGTYFTFFFPASGYANISAIYALGTPVFFIGCLAISIAFSHRLRRDARRGLAIGIGFYAVGNIIENAYLGSVDGQYFGWLVVWVIAAVLALRLCGRIAERSQHIFDAAQAARNTARPQSLWNSF